MDVRDLFCEGLGLHGTFSPSDTDHDDCGFGFLTFQKLQNLILQSFRFEILNSYLIHRCFFTPFFSTSCFFPIYIQTELTYRLIPARFDHWYLHFVTTYRRVDTQLHRLSLLRKHHQTTFTSQFKREF